MFIDNFKISDLELEIDYYIDDEDTYKIIFIFWMYNTKKKIYLNISRYIFIIYAII